MPRDRTKGPVQWLNVDPFFFHISNAWEEPDGTLRMESTHYDRTAWDKFGHWLMSLPGHPAWLAQGHKLARWHIDPAAGTARAELRSDISADFPTINQMLLGRRNRYTYAEAFPAEPCAATRSSRSTARPARSQCASTPRGSSPTSRGSYPTQPARPRTTAGC